MKTRIAVLVGIAVLMGALVGAEAALAQAGGGGGGGEEIGGNIGRLLSEWGTQIYLGLIAIGGLFFLLNQKYGLMAMWVCAALVIGMFVMSPDSVQTATEGLGNTIFGGSGGGAR
jgi:hypothetical protein